MISRDECHLTLTRECLERSTWYEELLRALDKMDACLAARNNPPAVHALVKVDNVSMSVHVYPRYDPFYANAKMEPGDIRRVADKQFRVW